VTTDNDTSGDEPLLHPNRKAHPKKKRPVAKRGDVDLLLKICWEQGADIVLGGNGHYKVYPANGERMVPIPATPSDWRTIRNKRGQLRRVGFDLKVKR
jgi:hypothetical protein